MEHRAGHGIFIVGGLGATVVINVGPYLLIEMSNITDIPLARISQADLKYVKIGNSEKEMIASHKKK